MASEAFMPFADLGAELKVRLQAWVNISVVPGFMRHRFAPAVAADRKGSRGLGQVPVHLSAASEK